MRSPELIDPEYYEQLVAATRPAAAAGMPTYGTADPLAGLVDDDHLTAVAEPKHRLLRYLREGIMPTTFCVGCGGGTVLNTFTNAIDEMNIDPREMVCVTGIGCSSWIPSP